MILKRLFCKHTYKSKGSRIFWDGKEYKKLRSLECTKCGKRTTEPWFKYR